MAATDEVTTSIGPCECCGTECCECTWPTDLCFELLQCDVTDGVTTYNLTLGSETVAGVYTNGCITAAGITSSGISHTAAPCSGFLPCLTQMLVTCGAGGELYGSVRISGTGLLTFCSSGAPIEPTAVALDTVDCSPLLLDSGVKSATVDGCTITWRFTVTEGPC